MRKTLRDMRPGESGVIVSFTGGQGFRSLMHSRGIREGRRIAVMTRHPFSGPVVVSIEGRATALGRGMAEKIIVETETGTKKHSGYGPGGGVG